MFQDSLLKSALKNLLKNTRVLSCLFCPGGFRRVFLEPCQWLSVNLLCLFLSQSMLTFDPSKRISSLNALEHPYFQDEEALTQTMR